MTARKSFLFLFLLLFVAAAPQASFAVDVKVLAAPRGETVWYVKDTTLPIVAMAAALPAGSAYDPNGKSGLAAFTAALLDEGAGTMNGQAFQAALADRAINLSVSPGRDYTVVTLLTLRENADEAFRLLGLALSAPRFDADAVARVRAQMLESLKQDQEQPGSVAGKAFNRLFFAGHPYAHSVDGDAGSLKAINEADLKAFAKTHWVRAGLKISVSGDVDEAQLKTWLDTAFGKLSAAAPAPIPAVRREGAPGTHIIPMAVPQPSIVFGLPGILRSDKDFLAGYVANYVLGGGGFSSRLMNQVREKRGLTYGIGTDLSTYRKAGLFAGQVATKRESVGQTIEVVREVMRDYAENGPTEKELADAKTYLTGSYPLAFDSNTGIAAQLNAFMRSGLPVDYVAKRNALINAISLEDARHAAKRLFNPAKLTIVVAGTPADSKPAAKQPASAK
jgi:zinc protease